MGISQNTKKDTAAFIKQFGITFPVLLDDTRTYPVSNAYGLTNVPSIFWIAEDGEIEISSVGWVRKEMEEFNQRAQDLGRVRSRCSSQRTGRRLSCRLRIEKLARGRGLKRRRARTSDLGLSPCHPERSRLDSRSESACGVEGPLCLQRGHALEFSFCRDWFSNNGHERIGVLRLRGFFAANGASAQDDSFRGESGSWSEV